ncbi:MAG TPA: hypothetical protein VFO10_27280 [Oligoflexus sp.]|uniref:GspE/PulE/PilB domain-containing protein n=1 Tax=Oligoflexus sp. TaxID=1971216 RepID=UPI002D80092F|nr:hypothetical protein [Oligoflexus sp.]HET9240999.1 hypothetical protein [Oligoflexus sp.]
MGASGLGALLVKEGFLTEQDRVTITKTCGQGSWAFAKCILSTGLLDEDELSAFFAERTKYVVAPKNLLDRLDPGIVEQVDRRMVSRLEVLPLEVDHHRITVAVADPLDKSTLKQLEFFTGLEVVPVIAPLSQIHEGLSRLNPEFKPRPTALSNFLRNHAGAAWIKQKIVDEGDVEIPEARGGALERYSEEQVEEVSLDDEMDAMDDNSDLNGIDASGLDEGVGNSDFDDIDLEDSGGDLELAPGEGHDLDADSIDDAGLDVDDPFDNFDDAPKKKGSVSAPSDDELEGLEAGSDIGDDLWPDADDVPAKPAPPAKAKAKASDLPDDFGLDDEPVKPKKAAKSDELDDFGLDEEASASGDASDDFGLEDEPVKPAKKTARTEAMDEFGLDDESAAADEEAMDDFGLDDESAAGGLSDEPGWDDEPKAPTKKAAKAEAMDEFSDDDDELSASDEESPAAAVVFETSGDDDSGDDLLGDTPDLSLDADAESEKLDEDSSLDDLSFGDDASALLDEPEPPVAAKPSGPRLKPPVESTRMAQKPDMTPSLGDEPEDLTGLEFADDDEETSVHLRKAVHEEGSEPEFRDPNFDDEPEDTRIDLHAAVDEDLEFSADTAEDTNIHLNPAADKEKPKKSPAAKISDPLEDLAMGFSDDESIDEQGPAIDDFASDGALDDIPIEAPTPSARAGGRLVPADDNGSLASLTATAKANEALLRMSLCFDRDTALEIAREYLPQISGTGCLVNIGKTTEALATWRSGAQSAAQGKSAVYQRLAKAAKPNQWSEIPVSAQDDFGPVKAISVYKIQGADGRILLLAGDYPKEDDSLREVLTSLAVQLGAK